MIKALKRWLRDSECLPHVQRTQVGFPALRGGSQPPQLQLLEIWCPLLVSAGSWTHMWTWARTDKHTHKSFRKEVWLDFLIILLSTVIVCEDSSPEQLRRKFCLFDWHLQGVQVILKALKYYLWSFHESTRKQEVWKGYHILWNNR